MKDAVTYKTCGIAMTDVLAAGLIIAVAAGVLFPALVRHRENSMRAMCRRNLGSIAAAALVYAGEHGGMLPPTCSRNYATNRIGAPGRRLFGAGLLLEGGYLEKPEVFGCPGSNYARPEYFTEKYEREALPRSAYLYRAESGGGYLVLEETGPSLVMDFNVETYGKFNHGGEYVNVAFTDGSTGGFADGTGELTLPMDGPFYMDNAFRMADRLYGGADEE